MSSDVRWPGLVVIGLDKNATYLQSDPVLLPHLAQL